MKCNEMEWNGLECKKECDCIQRIMVKIRSSNLLILGLSTEFNEFKKNLSLSLKRILV